MNRKKLDGDKNTINKNKLKIWNKIGDKTSKNAMGREVWGIAGHDKEVYPKRSGIKISRSQYNILLKTDWLLMAKVSVLLQPEITDKSEDDIQKEI